MSSSAPVVVIGAGISGVQCARELRAAGIPVRLIDRGWRIGGRMGGKRIDDRHVDLGASYFTVSDDGFAEVVEAAEGAGVVRRWTDTFTALSDEGSEQKQGPQRWGAGDGGLRGFVEHLAHDVDVQHPVAVDSVTLEGEHLKVDGQTAPAIVLAMPDEQASRLLGPALAHIAERLQRRFEPTLALAAGFDSRSWDRDGWFVNDDDVIEWIADDGARRGDGAAVLVAHSTPQFARPHLEDPRAAAPAMVEALQKVLDLSEPRWTHLHRWSLAKPAGDRDERYLLEQVGDAGTAGLVGVCGDGWGPVSKVEGAWSSGRDLGRALAARLT